MQALADKHVVVGVTGGIAAYKAADLVRRLREAGAEVRVVMTDAAARFITPLTLQALSGQRVQRDLFDPESEASMGHIDLARWADMVLVAPATADFMARLAHGMAGDLLATLCLATHSPVVLAPAMNQGMWAHPATQANAALLRERGCRLLGPGEGSQACGDVGPGRMLEPHDIVAMAAAHLTPGPLAGLHVLVTAGPTREAIDPVRCLTNNSSGKMGYAVAGAALEAGARVTLISGPVALPAPAGVERLDVTSAAEMLEVVLARVPAADILVAAAAVADYRPRRRSDRKLKKGPEALSLELEPTQDILSAVMGLAQRPFTVGFAAETDDLERNARAKLTGKGLDMIAANPVGAPGVGFEGDWNELTLYWPDGERRLTRDTKARLAREMIITIVERYHAKSPAQDT